MFAKISKKFIENLADRNFAKVIYRKFVNPKVKFYKVAR